MAERCQQAGLLPGDTLDIAFTIENNDHPEYGGLELSLRDFAQTGENCRRHYVGTAEDRCGPVSPETRLRTEI